MPLIVIKLPNLVLRIRPNHAQFQLGSTCPQITSMVATLCPIWAKQVCSATRNSARLRTLDPLNLTKSGQDHSPSQHRGSYPFGSQVLKIRNNGGTLAMD